MHEGMQSRDSLFQAVDIGRILSYSYFVSNLFSTQ